MHKIFPFAPGIPWELSKENFIIPKISNIYWQNAIKNRDITVACFGGLIEAFFSITFLEMFNVLMPSKKLYWAGDPKFADLIRDNALAIPMFNLTQKDIENFPAPMFLDADKNIYFNILFNYLKVYNFYGDLIFKNKKAIFKQIFNNSLVKWDKQYLPKVRKNTDQSILEWIKINRFPINKPYVVIFPDATGMSIHKKPCLNWGPTQVKALGAILAQRGISLLVFAINPGRYYDVYTKVMPFKLQFISYFISTSIAILSKEIDFLLMAALNSKALIVSEPITNELKIQKNTKFINEDLRAYSWINLTPNLVADKVRQYVG